ncbi:MAG: nucleotidyltransferase domain-containing protein [Nanoarchaeota archaeon]|nr:nucleotidyltransferase domain-containing protein [Nanoarchaeota archaeon]
MPYTELKIRNSNTYYYRSISLRQGSKIGKKRAYMGKNLSLKELAKKEIETDKQMLSEKVSRNINFIKSKIMNVLIKYKIKKAGVFGSYARGDNKKRSDIDIIIEPPKKIGYGFVGIALELEEVLKKKVDLITYKSVSPFIKEYIFRDEIKII